MPYTHNLKIILLDNNNNIIENKNILNKIKNILFIVNIYNIEWNVLILNISIKWDKILLSYLNQELMGDLFSYPIYPDRIIYNNTKETILKINCKYIIKFYISKILCYNLIDKNCIGLV